MKKLLQKYQKAKKAVNGALVQLGTAVAIFAPDYSDKYKAGVAAVGAAASLLVIFYSENKE